MKANWFLNPSIDYRNLSPRKQGEAVMNISYFRAFTNCFHHYYLLQGVIVVVLFLFQIHLKSSRENLPISALNIFSLSVTTSSSFASSE